MNWEDIQNKYGHYVFYSLPGIFAQDPIYYGRIFIARFPIEILRISEVHNIAGTFGGAVTLNVQKLEDGQTPGTGTNILTNPFDLKDTANYVNIREKTDLSTTARILKENESLYLISSGALTDLVGVQVTIYYKLANKGHYR